MSEPQPNEAPANSSPLEVIERMAGYANRHDLDGMVACFSRDYQSEQPFQPELNFVGQAGVQKNWGLFFNATPDIQMDILSAAVDGDTIWSELHIHGTQVDGKKRSTRGVTIQRIQGGLIVWARLYIATPTEPNEDRLL